jgi:hypothetical protein
MTLGDVGALIIVVCLAAAIPFVLRSTVRNAKGQGVYADIVRLIYRHIPYLRNSLDRPGWGPELTTIRRRKRRRRGSPPAD